MYIKCEFNFDNNCINNKPFNTWFILEKHKYIITIQECATKYNINLPQEIAEIIIISSILLPGCYTLIGLSFPPSRNESDLFIEYANIETGYITNKTNNGITYTRQKPTLNIKRPENNTSSLWLDEDGTICGFACIWVQDLNGKLRVTQKFYVLNGCWSLTGEITIIFKKENVEHEFVGYLDTECFYGRWNSVKEVYGEFQWFINCVESFYLNHNIPYDLRDISNNSQISNLLSNYNYNILYNKIFDIEVNKSLTIKVKFLKKYNISVSVIYQKKQNQIIGYGEWYRNGKILFKNVKCFKQKIVLLFDGICNGKKVLGCLSTYNTKQQSYDNHQDNDEYDYNNTISFIEKFIVSYIVSA